MAIVYNGVRCNICGEIIAANQRSRAFPPLVGNRNDPLFSFNDGVVHDHCLRAHTSGRRAIAMAALAARRRRNRKCEECTEQILNPDDFLGFGVLDSRREGLLFKYNFLQFHRDHLKRWKHFDRFRLDLEAIQFSEHWAGPILVLDEDRESKPHWRSQP